MYARKKAGHGWLWFLLLIIAVSVLIGSAVGKYRRSFTLEQATVTFTAKLAESVTLQEHKANRQPDGSYELDENSTVAEMEYTLIPGLDVPKDPYVTIINKTPIDSYLFVEVCPILPVIDGQDVIEFSVDTEHWLKLDITGKNGGTVYVYTTNGSEPAVVDENVPAETVTLEGVDKKRFTVSILEGNTITVSQKLKSMDKADKLLIFYACLGETAFSSETDPAEKAIDVYKKMNNMT